MMSEIRLHNVYSYYDEKNEEIEEFLKVKHPSYKYMEAYRQGVWDGYVKFVKRDIRGVYYFPSGFIFAFPDFFKKFKIVDLRKRPECVRQDYKLDIELRKYQCEAIEKALEAERGILNMATNAGKTEVAIAIMKALKDLNVLYLVHRQHLMFQTKKRIEDRLKEECGYIGAGKRENLKSRIIVATIQSFYNLIYNKKFREYLKRFSVCFWDEVHHLQADTWYKVSGLIPAYYRFGLSATVPQKKSMSLFRLVGMTGSVIYRLKQKELVEAGISALPQIYIYEVPLTPLQGFRIDYNQAYRKFIEEDTNRNLLIQRICAKYKDKRKVIIVKTIKHGEILLNRIKNDSVLLTGRETIWERLKVLEKFKKGEVKCIIATNWFEEGTDIPEIEVFINASGGLSDRQLIQRMGRALRRKEGENKVIIIDFWDTANKYLLKHSKERVKLYKEEGFEVVKVKPIFRENDELKQGGVL